MKKFLAVTIFLLISAVSFGQHTQIGVKGGINLSTLNVENNDAYNSKIGLHAGLLAHIHASETWALQPEVIYSLEGASYKAGNNDVDVILNYINIPVMLQYMFHNGVRLEGGPQFGILLNAKTKTQNATVDNNSYKSSTFSIPLGIGYLTTNGLGFDARYVFGLSNIKKDEHPTVQSNVFQFGVFYQFKGHR